MPNSGRTTFKTFACTGKRCANERLLCGVVMTAIHRVAWNERREHNPCGASEPPLVTFREQGENALLLLINDKYPNSMKKSKLFRCCTFIGIVATFSLALVSYKAVIAAFVITGICAVAWMIYGYYEWYDEQQSKHAKWATYHALPIQHATTAHGYTIPARTIAAGRGTMRTAEQNAKRGVLAHCKMNERPYIIRYSLDITM